MCYNIPEIRQRTNFVARHPNVGIFCSLFPSLSAFLRPKDSILFSHFRFLRVRAPMLHLPCVHWRGFHGQAPQGHRRRTWYARPLLWCSEQVWGRWVKSVIDLGFNPVSFSQLSSWLPSCCHRGDWRHDCHDPQAGRVTFFLFFWCLFPSFFCSRIYLSAKCSSLSSTLFVFLASYHHRLSTHLCKRCHCPSWI